MQTGQEVLRLTDHASEIRRAIFSPAGKSILTASNDGTALLWLVDDRDTMRAVCAVLTRDLTDEERKQFKISNQKRVENQPTKRETAKAQNQPQKTRRVPAVR